MFVSDQSGNRLNQLLPAPLSEDSAKVLDAELMEAIRSVVARLNRCEDDTKITKDALEVLSGALSILEKRQSLPWSYWARMSKLRVAIKTQPELKRMKVLASQYLAHPQLRCDWREMIEQVISCALLYKDEYSSFKVEPGLIDFVDQKLLALELLGSGLLHNHLAEKCKVLMVDEFQDTSPIQLAVFLHLAQTVEESIWVGDVKQSIFGFRGADPDLVNQVCELLVPETAGSESKLSTSYRSRSELVSFSNTLFG